MLQCAKNQVPEAGSFDSPIDYLYDHKLEQSREEILMQDGRIIDRYSAPMAGPGVDYYGRILFFRDVTERKRAEPALREGEQQPTHEEAPPGR